MSNEKHLESVALVVRRKCENLADYITAEIGLDEAERVAVADILQERFQKGDISLGD